MRAKKLFYALTLLAGASSLCGCTACAQRWAAYQQCKADERLSKQQILAEDLQSLKEELEAERRAIQAERELELACDRADCEKRACQLRSQYDESVRTKLGLDLDQRVQVGQLQVNMPEMQRLMAERERDYADRMRTYNQLKAAERERATREWKQSHMEPCCTCAEPSCEAPGPNCDAPAAGACCCQKCGLPVVQPQNVADCAGTRPFREGPKKPVKQPVLAQELPMMLPVQLEVGVTNSYVNQSQVRRVPYEGARRALQAQHEPCGQCPGCCNGQKCQRCVPATSPSCEAPQTRGTGTKVTPVVSPRPMREPEPIEGANRARGRAHLQTDDSEFVDPTEFEDDVGDSTLSSSNGRYMSNRRGRAKLR
jgi:hypothetical protein